MAAWQNKAPHTRHRRLLGGFGAGLLVLALGCFGSGSAGAETLKEALHATYKFNPRLDAARSIQRATDEEVPRALSGYRPSITGSADTSYELQTVRPTGGAGSATTESNPRGYQVGAVQPIFRGFRTKNAVSAAEATVRAGWEALRTTESSVLLEAVTSYMDVVRDQAILTSAREQRHGSDARSEGDAGPVCGRRGDAHGRGAGAGAACGCGGGARPGACQPEDQPCGVRAGGWASAERPGGARPVDTGAQEPGREHRDRFAREPGRGCGAVPGAGGAVQHRSDPGRAAADGAAGGQLRAAVRCLGVASTRRRRRR